MLQKVLSPTSHLVQCTRRIPVARSVARSIATRSLSTIGTVPSLGNFAIDAHSPLGVGAHATVYWGRDRTLEQDVALKVMWESPNSIVKETEVFEELLASGEMHPNVVDVMSNFVSPGAEARKAGFMMPQDAFEKPVHIFVTEFLGGGSLADAIKHKRASGTSFEAQEVLDVALSVSEGLGFLHTHGVVHRDVKPENLIYSNSRELKLIDFSLAGVAPNTPKEEMVFHGNVGTKGFVAPEVLRGGQPYGPSCDIFSLGCVLHTMLAGEPPSVKLLDTNPNSKLSAQVTMCLPQKLSNATRNFVASLLSVNPAARPAAFEILELCSKLSVVHTREMWD